MRCFGIALTLLVACLATANVARATTFTYSNYSVTNEQGISIVKPQDIDAGAGQIVLQGTKADAGTTLMAWCLDLYDTLEGNKRNQSYTYTVGALTTAGAGGANPSLSLTQIGEIGGLILEGDSLLANATNHSSKLVSAAIQIAIWTIEYGNNFKLSFWNDGNLTTLAASYVADIENGVWGLDYGVDLLSGHGNQTLAFIDPNFSNPATPIPGTLGLFGGGLALLALAGWRKRRKQPRAAEMIGIRA